jgi:alpha-N-arabinofuranosidase
MLSFDEWNVWYRTRRPAANRTMPGWPVAPPILEEVYNMQDALALGGACISLLNHADRVRSACLAQLVNVIAPIMTETGGPAWRQTIFWPFAHMSNHGRGDVLRTVVASETYAAEYFDPRGPNDPAIPLPCVPYLKLAAVHNDGGGLTLFALNRELEQEMQLQVTARGFTGLRVVEATTLHSADLLAVNSKDTPDRVGPVALSACEVREGVVAATLPPASWTVIRLASG